MKDGLNACTTIGDKPRLSVCLSKGVRESLFLEPSEGGFLADDLDFFECFD